MNARRARGLGRAFEEKTMQRHATPRRRAEQPPARILISLSSPPTARIIAGFEQQARAQHLAALLLAILGVELREPAAGAAR